MWTSGAPREPRTTPAAAILHRRMPMMQESSHTSAFRLESGLSHVQNITCSSMSPSVSAVSFSCSVPACPGYGRDCGKPYGSARIQNTAVRSQKL